MNADFYHAAKCFSVATTTVNYWLFCEKFCDACLRGEFPEPTTTPVSSSLTQTKRVVTIGCHISQECLIGCAGSRRGRRLRQLQQPAGICNSPEDACCWLMPPLNQSTGTGHLSNVERTAALRPAYIFILVLINVMWETDNPGHKKKWYGWKQVIGAAVSQPVRKICLV